MEKVSVMPGDRHSSPDKIDVGMNEMVDLESCQPHNLRKGWFGRLWRASNPEERKITSDDVKPITRILDDLPKGYSQLAAFLSSDRNFMQYRGFVWLHARVLLSLQCELEYLERELDRLDSWDRKHGEYQKLQCQQNDVLENSVDNVEGPFPYTRTRPKVLAVIKQKLIEYDEVALKARSIASLQQPSETDWQSAKLWILQEAPLVAEEQEFILRKEDIVTLRTARESAMFDTFVERNLRRLDVFFENRCKSDIIKRIFTAPELRERTADKLTHYYTPGRIDKLVNGFITTIIFVLLVLPVIALYQLSNLQDQASPIEAGAILIVFTLLFGIAMSGLTKSRRQELFAASAAYCAVLVVFIGNFNTQTVTLAKAKTP